MRLLSDEDRERGWKLIRLALIAAVIWLGYQCFLNLHRYNAVETNLYSLGQELNITGEREYRQQLFAILRTNSVELSETDITVKLDQTTDVYEVTVPARWTLDLIFWKWELRGVHRAKIRRETALRS